MEILIDEGSWGASEGGHGIGILKETDKDERMELISASTRPGEALGFDKGDARE